MKSAASLIVALAMTAALGAQNDLRLMFFAAFAAFAFKRA